MALLVLFSVSCQSSRLGSNEEPPPELSLPAGFSYQIISEAGKTMSDGLRLPGKPDDMAAFAGKA